MALVFLVILFSIDFIEILISSLLTSTKTGVAPVYNTTFAVATNVIFGIITSSPFPIPNDLRDR